MMRLSSSAADIAGKRADRDAEAEADRHADESDEHRDARAIDDARKEIAPEAFAPHQKIWRRAGFGGEEMPVRKQMDVGLAAAILGELARLRVHHRHRIRIEKCMRPFGWRAEMQPHRRAIGQAPILIGRIVGRDDRRRDRKQVEEQAGRTPRSAPATRPSAIRAANHRDSRCSGAGGASCNEVNGRGAALIANPSRRNRRADRPRPARHRRAGCRAATAPCPSAPNPSRGRYRASAPH